jgi:hypothetical protein
MVLITVVFMIECAFNNVKLQFPILYLSNVGLVSGTLYTSVVILQWGVYKRESTREFLEIIYQFDMSNPEILN